MEVIEEVVLTIMDWVEDFFGSLTKIGNIKIYKALYFTVGALVFSLVCNFIHLPTFISWEEGLSAVLINVSMIITGCITRNGIKELQSKIGGSKNGKSE